MLTIDAIIELPLLPKKIRFLIFPIKSIRITNIITTIIRLGLINNKIVNIDNAIVNKLPFDPSAKLNAFCKARKQKIVNIKSKLFVAIN